MYYRVGLKRPHRGFSVGHKRPFIELGIGKKSLSNIDIGLRKLSNTIKGVAPIARDLGPAAAPYVAGARIGAYLIDSARPALRREIDKRQRKSLGN